MSVPGVTTTITGMESGEVLRQNIGLARAFNFKPMSAEQMQEAVAAAFAAPSPRVDHFFAMVANASSNAEIAFAELALQRGRTDEIKSYTRKMISEHIGLMRALAPHLRRVLGKIPRMNFQHRMR